MLGGGGGGGTPGSPFGGSGVDGKVIKPLEVIINDNWKLIKNGSVPDSDLSIQNNSSGNWVEKGSFSVNP